GEMLAAIDQLVQGEYAALGVGAALSGESYQESTSTGGGLVLALGIIMVFLVLAAYLGMWLRGIPSDVYFQIGIITVVGLAAKNAILIVEFASELRAQG